MKHLKLKKYKITWQEDQLDREPVPEALLKELEKIYSEIRRPKKDTVKKLRNLIGQYPENPQLKNFLSSVYKELGENDISSQINDDLLKEHPGYFFGRANKAQEYERENDFDKMEELMGKGFDLQTLYPDREVFHAEEFMAMGSLAVGYYAGIGEIEEAEKRLELMREVDPDSISVKYSEEKLKIRLMERTLEQVKRDEEMRITPENTFSVKPSSHSLPAFHYEETLDLSDEYFGDDQELVRQYMSLDRQKVVEDLENLLKDHFYHYPEKQDEYFDAPFHTLMILGELEAAESLPVILEMMGQSREYFVDVFDHLFTEFAWIVLFKTGQNQLPLLEDYLRKPGKYTYFRAGVTDALKQIYLHLPEKRMDVTAIYDRLLTFYHQVELEDNIIDNEFNGFIVADLLDLGLEQFLPKIEQLYKRGYVHPTISGSYAEVEKAMKEERKDISFYKRDLLSLEEIYQYLYEDAGDSGSHSIGLPGILSEHLEDFGYDNDFGGSEPYKREHQKVGRNDPCPCGSGKKFKKCCQRKGIY